MMASHPPFGTLRKLRRLSGLRLLVLGAVKAQIALAERRIDEPAMVRLGLAPVAVRGKVATAHAHALPRNGAFTLQGVNRADDDTEQRRLILCAEDASHCGEALRPTTRKRPAAAGHAQHEGAAVFRIGQFLDKCLAQKRRRRVARGRLTDVEVRGHGARAKPARAVITNMHIDLDYETLRAELPPHITPAFDGMTVTYDNQP